MSSNAVLTVYVPVCTPPAQGLVSWWRGEGDASDFVGINNGVLEGGMAFATGEVGQAFSFDGTNADVRVPASASLNVGLAGGFTIETWIQPGDVTSGHPLAEWNNGSTYGTHFWIFGNPQSIYMNVLDTSGTSHDLNAPANILNTTNFQHVAATYDKASGVATLYYNGLAVATANFGSVTPQTSYNLFLGRRPAGVSSGYYQGLMDEVSLYSRALSASEIQAIYNAGRTGKCLTGTPPSISAQPASQIVTVGSAVAFTVTAGGTPPLSYQWCFNGANLAGANSVTLALTNVQFVDAGTYSVVVSNLAGSVTSSNAELIVNPASPCAPVAPGLVSWWRGEGDASDFVGINNGVLEGGMAFATGEVGQAFSFNGTNADVRVPASASLNVGLAGGFTIETWIQPGDVTSGHPLAEWNNGSTYGTHFWIFGNPQSIYMNVLDTSGTCHDLNAPANILNTTNFQHVAATYDKASGVATLYYNGLAVATANFGSVTPQTSYNLFLGRRPAGVSSGYYQGLMDEVSLYSRALSASEIQAIYNAGSAGKCGLAPAILTPPQSQTVECSSNASFSVTATGLAPLTYGWSFGSNSIPGATNTLLTLTNVGFAQAGNYSVIVTNAYGSATGGPAMLTVVDTIPPTIISCASNRTLSVGANCTATLPDLTGEVVATDASGPVTVTQNPPPGTQLGLGITNVAFTVRGFLRQCVLLCQHRYGS